MPTTLKGIKIKAGENVSHIVKAIQEAGGRIKLPFSATGMEVTENADLLPDEMKKPVEARPTDFRDEVIKSELEVEEKPVAVEKPKAKRRRTK